MSEGSDNYTSRVTLDDDGVYRWYYDMDMYENRSMLYMLEKINLFTFLGVSLGGALFTGLISRDFSDPFVRGIFLTGLALGALMAVLYLVGFYIAAWIKGGRYRIRYAMREDGIGIVWSDPVKQGFRVGRDSMRLFGSLVGSRRVRGRWRPTLDEVSNVTFASITRFKRHRDWDMIDLSLIGGKFQVYAQFDDIDFVEDFILERIPERARDNAIR
ncbi:MAG: hypothetical protein IJJ45_01085 [Clostridia bacterium]|nr:hypothetical protein [Clostridia bacterium]